MCAEPLVRRGAALIIVIGLAAMLLSMTTVFLARMRSDSVEMRLVMQDTQARLMLHASLMYLQEGSRLGWGDTTGECFGWTDARDGGLGPRGPRPAGAGGTAADIPSPSWWPASTTYSPLGGDSALPTTGNRTWPMPGSSIRAPMAVAERTPYATRLTFCYNPVMPMRSDGTAVPYDAADWDTTGWQQKTDEWPAGWTVKALSAPTGFGMLDPQPVADKWTDAATDDQFQEGKTTTGAVGDWGHTWPTAFNPQGYPTTFRTKRLAIVPETENQSWFRVYREIQADHDNDGDPFYDRVALYDPTDPAIKNWSVFIVACGAGATRGYRFWDQADISAWAATTGLSAQIGRDLEPVTASESGLFPDEAFFREALAGSRILWFRVEWSAMQGGGWDGNTYRVAYNQAQELSLGTVYKSYTSVRSRSPRSFLGNFRWIQRLDREPPKW